MLRMMDEMEWNGMDVVTTEGCTLVGIRMGLDFAMRDSTGFLRVVERVVVQCSVSVSVKHQQYSSSLSHSSSPPAMPRDNQQAVIVSFISPIATIFLQLTHSTTGGHLKQGSIRRHPYKAR